jgi:hypothetical protein
LILVGMNTGNGRPAFNGNRAWMFRDASVTLRCALTTSRWTTCRSVFL